MNRRKGSTTSALGGCLTKRAGSVAAFGAGRISSWRIRCRDALLLFSLGQAAAAAGLAAAGQEGHIAGVILEPLDAHSPDGAVGNHMQRRVARVLRLLVRIIAGGVVAA